MQVAQFETYREHPIEWTDEKVVRAWDYFARTNSVYFSQLYGDQILKRTGLSFRQRLNVLDFGCGPGFMWEHLRSLNNQWEYTGLDFSPESVDAVTQKAAGQAGFAGVEHVYELPSSLPDASFDATLLVEVVEHLSEEHLESTLAETSRTLKTGGVLVITTPHEEDLDAKKHLCPECGAIFHAWQHVRSWSIGSLESVVQKHGFKTRTAYALDFGAQGPFRQALRLGRKLLGRRLVKPHLFSVFEKC